MRLEIAVREVGEDAAVIILSGEMDIYSSHRLLEEIYTLAGEGRLFIVLDLSNLAYMDSTGLGAMTAGLKRVREVDGHIRLVSPRSAVAKVLNVTDLDQVFRAYESVEEAVDSGIWV